MTRPIRRVALVAGVCVLFLAIPVAASAHAALSSADPMPGQELGSTPGVVKMHFSEPLNQQLSVAQVTDPGGKVFAGKTAGSTEIDVPLSSNAPGIYKVSWTTVSEFDGHTLRGSYSFGVGVPAPSSGEEGNVQLGPRSADLFVALLRAIEDAALLLAIGMLLVGRLSRRPPGLSWVKPRINWAVIALAVSALALVAGEAITAGASPSFAGAWSFLVTGVPGLARAASVPALVAAAILAIGRRRGVATLIVLAATLLAASGHAVSIHPAWFGVFIEAVHVVSAGCWAGGILALASLRPPEGWRSAQAKDLLDRWSPVAFWAFGITVATGVLRGHQEVGSLSGLFTSAYGIVLLVKALLVVVMIQLSVLAWKRITGSPRFEAALAVGVIGAAAMLAAFPLPPSGIAANEAVPNAAGSVASSSSALPAKSDLTLGADAGQVLVGLSLSPAIPGPNKILIYLLPLSGDAEGLQVSLSVESASVPIASCGSGCRSAETDLTGGENVSVRIAGSAGGTASFHIPALPAPSGTKLLAEAQRRIHQLHTYRMAETLNSGLVTQHSNYQFQAPHTLLILGTNGFERLLIGSSEYRKTGSGQPWTKQAGVPLKVPVFQWDFFKPYRNVSIIGHQMIGSHATTIISLFSDNVATPIWFRLWVDRRGLVLRGEMRAQGHFMDQQFSGFDAPLNLRAPSVK